MKTLFKTLLDYFKKYICNFFKQYNNLVILLKKILQ